MQQAVKGLARDCCKKFWQQLWEFFKRKQGVNWIPEKTRSIKIAVIPKRLIDTNIEEYPCYVKQGSKNIIRLTSNFFENLPIIGRGGIHYDMADSTCQPGAFRIPNALERDWHKFEAPVAIEAFDLNCDGKIDLLLREDTLQAPRKEELRPDYRPLLQTNHSFSKNFFKPLNVARQQTLAQVLRGPIQQSPEKRGLAPLMIAAGIASLVVAPEVTIPLMAGGLLAAGAPGCSTEDAICLSGEVDCEAIEKACANKGTAIVTKLPRKPFSSWWKEGYFVEDYVSLLADRIWDPEKKAFVSFYIERGRNKVHILVEPIDYPKQEPKLYSFDNPFEESKDFTFSTVMDASGNMFAQGLGKIFRIDLSQEKPEVEVVISDNVWLNNTDSYYHSLLLNRENGSLQSIVRIDDYYGTPYTWVFWDKSFPPIDIEGWNWIGSIFQEDSKTIWMFGHTEITPNIDQLQRIHVGAELGVLKVSQESRSDILDALNKFYGFASNEADIKFLGIDPANQKLFFKVWPKKAPDAANLDGLNAGILSIDPKTLEVKELATAKNFLDAFGLPCDPQELIKMAMDDPEEARMYLNKMEYLEELTPVDEKHLVGNAGGTLFQMKLP